MNISDVIEILLQIREERGNVPFAVLIRNEDAFGFEFCVRFSAHLVDGKEIATLEFPDEDGIGPYPETLKSSRRAHLRSVRDPF